MPEPFAECRECGNNMIKVSPEDSSPLIVECQKCGLREYVEVQISPPWAPAADDPPIDEPETSETKERFRFLDLKAMPVSVGIPGEESTPFPIGWIFLWIIVISLIALIGLSLWIIF
ncbi:hypothetical protein ACFL47_01355 [Candidatus Latescibacterota bacterium]